MSRRREDGWCILRTSGGKTLLLVKSLCRAGIEAWTPAQVVRVRRPRSTKVVEYDKPMIATFVFARSSQLDELLRIVTMPPGPHPQFTLFTDNGRVGTVTDADIRGLRDTEAAARRRHARQRRPRLRIGKQVVLTEGCYSGLVGRIEGGSGNYAIVAMDGKRIKIASWLLPQDAVMSDAGGPATGHAARAA